MRLADDAPCRTAAQARAGDLAVAALLAREVEWQRCALAAAAGHEDGAP